MKLSFGSLESQAETAEIASADWTRASPNRNSRCRSVRCRHDLRQQHLPKGLLRKRTDKAIGDRAIRLDHIGFRHAIDAEIDARSTGRVDADAREGIAALP